MKNLRELKDLKNKKVLLIDDFIRTGDTMRTIYDYINQYKPKQIVTLISSKPRKDLNTKIRIDYMLPRAYQNVLPYGFDA